MQECINYLSIARLTHISLEEKPTKQEKESGGTTEVITFIMPNLTTNWSTYEQSETPVLEFVVYASIA
jgi:hypothetical protein